MRRLLRLGNIGPPQRQPITVDEVHRLQQEIVELKEQREEDQGRFITMQDDIDMLSDELSVQRALIATLTELVRRAENAEGPRHHELPPLDAQIGSKVKTTTTTTKPPPAAAAAEAESLLPRLPKKIV